MLGLKFHQKNFYQDIYHFIIDLINDPQNSEEIFRKNMSELLFYCGKTDRNNGLFRSVPAPKKKDQEFADDDLTKTIKEILLNYAYQDIKWTFAGTTLSLTDISKDNLANNNIKYEDLLPVELKNKNKRKTDENKIYIYPDGSFSVDQYKKVKITYKDLADSSGFNWEKGYSFENKVRNKNWKAGFNSQGSWEIGDSNKNSIQKSNYIFPSVIKDNDNFTFLIISDEKKKENEAILFDNNSVLLNGSERKFYDKDHKLSKVEKIDIDKSLDKIKDFFKKNGLDKITGIVVNKINNKIIKNYKNVLGNIVSEKLRFYTEGSPEINLLLKNYLSGSDKNNKDKIQKVNFDIIENKKDLNNFLKALVFNKKLSVNEKKDVAEFINNLNIPDNKNKKISKLFQNVLIKDHSFFTKINMKRIELLDIVYNAVMNKKSGNELKLKYKTDLYDFIANDKSDMSFNSKIMHGIKVKSINFKSAEKFKIRLKENKILKNIDDAVVSDMAKKTDRLPVKKRKMFLKKIQTVFAKFNSAGNFSGINPLLISDAVYNIILKKNIGLYKSRELTFEKNLNDFISGLNEESPSFIKKVKSRQKRYNFIFKDKINFFDEADLNIFKGSKIFKSLKPENQLGFIEYMKETIIPLNIRDEFNFKLVKILVKHHDDDRLIRKIMILKNDIIKSNINSFSINHVYNNILKIPYHYSCDNTDKNNDIQDLIYSDIEKTKSEYIDNMGKIFNKSDLNNPDEFNFNNQICTIPINKIKETIINRIDNRNVVKKIYLNEIDDIIRPFNENNLKTEDNYIQCFSADLNNEKNYNLKKTDVNLFENSERFKKKYKNLNPAEINYYEDKKKLSNENFKLEEASDNNIMINNAEEIDMAVEDILNVIKRELSDEL